MKQKIEFSEKTKRFAFLKNRFHTFECNRSNQKKQVGRNVMFSCAKGVKYIHEAAKNRCALTDAHSCYTGSSSGSLIYVTERYTFEIILGST